MKGVLGFFFFRVDFLGFFFVPVSRHARLAFASTARTRIVADVKNPVPLQTQFSQEMKKPKARS